MSKYLELSTGLVVRNNNPLVWLVEQTNVKGGLHQYSTLENFVQLHPQKMVVNMEATVGQHTRTGGIFPVTKFTLDVIPDVADWPLSLDEADDNYFGNYWRKIQELKVQQTPTVYEYAPDINGLKPTYPYVSGQESSWVSTYDPTKNHKWLRFRNSDRDDNSDGIYDDWSIPRPINGNFTSGDYVANLFIRSATTPSLPPTLINGLPNNYPENWEDTPPSGANPLYKINGQKDVYGNLKSDWIGPFLIPEDEDIVRYNSNSTPNINSIVDNTTPATDPSQANTDLNNAGWVKTFNPNIHSYMAQRVKNGINDYTQWEITKIADESGEYTEFIYKLFPINTDFDDTTFIANNTPTINNPIEGTTSPNTGWSDVPLEETDTYINCVSTVRKFFDGSLKTPWSAPKPFTGKSVFSDVITSNGQNSFKYTSSTDATPTPSSITLTYTLYKGISPITTGITYKWYKVYNNDTASEPTLDGNGLPTSTPLATTQTLNVVPGDVTGKAIFRCYGILEVTGGDDLIFSDEEAIVDITDGDDAKSLIISPESQLTVYNASTTNYSVSTIRLRYYQSFLDGETFTWFKWNGSSWDALSNGVGGYTISGNLLSIASSDLFTEDTTSEEARFAISTHASDPENASTFNDQQTIGKTGVSNGTATDGSDGVDSTIALLDNEVHNIVLDQLTGDPQTGEVAKAKTILSVYTGNLKKVAGTDYTIALSSDNGDVTFTSTDLGNDYEISVSAWGTSEISATCTITITYGSLTLTKKFTVTATYDNAGATIADIDLASTSPNKTFTFTSQNRDNEIYLEANLYQNGVQVSESSITSYTWYFNNVNVSGISFSGSGNRFNQETTNKGDIIRINRNDALNVINVSCSIVYSGKTYTAVGITIDDVLDNQAYLLYYNYSTVPSEPITKPSAPATAAWSSFSNTGNDGWFKETQSNSYFFVIGYENSAGNIVFGQVQRYRGEKGVQGPSSDFIMYLYKKNSSSVPSNDATINEMTTDIGADPDAGWSKVPSTVSGSEILYKAVGNFDGSKFGDDNQGPDGIWYIYQENALNGATGATGSTGSKGDDGNTILSGTNNPTTEGVDGDFYINTSTSTIFGPKTSGSWGSGTSLIGEDGENGYSQGLRNNITYANLDQDSSTTKEANKSNITVLRSTSNITGNWLAMINFSVNIAKQGSSRDPLQINLYRRIDGGSWTFINRWLITSPDWWSIITFNHNDYITAGSTQEYEYGVETKNVDSSFTHYFKSNGSGSDLALAGGLALIKIN